MPIKRGQYRRVKFQLSTKPSGYVDLTGVPLLCHIRETPKSPSILLVMSTANGKIEIPEPTNGRIDLIFSTTDTALLTVDAPYFDVVHATSRAEYFSGRLMVEQGVTHD